MNIIERFISYAKIDTQSNPKSDTTPSTEKQFDLAKVLVQQLKDMGVEDATLTDTCYVYGHIPSNIDKEVATVGFIAHMDTAPDYSGTNVNPRVIENYDGKDIELCPGVVTKISSFPQLEKYKGETLIVTDGSTLLGADDKAGVTAIMEAVNYITSHPEFKHGRITIGFTPDEEIGQGTKCFDMELFDADFAYTMDGGEINLIADETFNAASAVVEFQGFSIHPGTAKDKMINASNLANEFHAMLPKWMRPEHTTNYEGFIHLTGMQGNVDHAVLEYILRDHDTQKLEAQKELIKKVGAVIGDIYGEDCIKITIKDSYQNMNNILKDHPHITSIAFDALKELGFEPDKEIVRGGTDGAMLTYAGLPCPNLGTGGGNMHGRYEYLVVSQLEAAAKLIEKIIEKVATSDDQKW